MDDTDLVQRYLHQQYHQLLDRLHLIFDRHPALAVRMIRGEVELYEKLVRSIAGRQERGAVDELEEFPRDDRTDDGR